VLILVENCSVPQDRRVWKESRALVDAGYRVSVICPRDAGQPRYEQLDGVSIHRFRATAQRAGTLGYVYEYASAIARMWARTVSIYVRDRFSAIQACNPPDALFAIALPFKLLGRPFVFDHHDLSPELFTERYGHTGGSVHRALLMLERITFRVADRVVTVNKPLHDVAIGRGRRSPRDITIVANGPVLADVDRAVAQPSLKNGRPLLCCWVGLMGAVDDGVDLALRAIAHLVHDLGRTDCTFVFIGNGELLGELTALRDALDIRDYVTFTGWLDQKDVFAHLATADLAIQPDPKNERTDKATPVKTLEYMAFGLPVVAFELVETRWTAGPAAAYAEPNEHRSFGREMHRLLGDDAARARMGQAGRSRVEQSLSWEAQRDGYVRVFDELLGRVQAPASR
jgi:asparagine synthase (glutamine-hydrolysing)